MSIVPPKATPRELELADEVERWKETAFAALRDAAHELFCERAIADFWETETARAACGDQDRCVCDCDFIVGQQIAWARGNFGGHYGDCPLAALWDEWDRETSEARGVPFIVQWHAKRRER